MSEGEVGELGIPFTEIDSVVQSLGHVLVERGWPKDQVVHQMIDGSLHGWFDEAQFWEDVLGPAVDRLAELLDLTGDPEEDLPYGTCGVCLGPNGIHSVNCPELYL